MTEKNDHHHQKGEEHWDDDKDMKKWGGGGASLWRANSWWDIWSQYNRRAHLSPLMGSVSPGAQNDVSQHAGPVLKLYKKKRYINSCPNTTKKLGSFN